MFSLFSYGIKSCNFFFPDYVGVTVNPPKSLTFINIGLLQVKHSLVDEDYFNFWKYAAHVVAKIMPVWCANIHTCWIPSALATTDEAVPLSLF